MFKSVAAGLIAGILLLAGVAFAASSVGDPVESVYAGLVQVPGSDATVAAQDICGSSVADAQVHKSFYGPAGADLASATAGEFDIVGAAHPFVAVTYPANSDLPTAIYLADANGLIIRVIDPTVDAVPNFCSLLPQAK